MDPDLIGIGIMVGIIILASSIGKAIMGSSKMPKGWRGQTVVQQVASADRQKALQVYENLVTEKLDVLKTALAMGYSQDELARLDARLEQLIGKEQLQKLSRGEVPAVGTELDSVNLSDETRKLREMKVAG